MFCVDIQEDQYNTSVRILDGHEIVASCRIGKKEALLWNFYVKKKFRRQGIAEYLLSVLDTLECPPKRLTACPFDDRPVPLEGLVQMYGKYGFRPVDVSDYQVTMERP